MTYAQTLPVAEDQLALLPEEPATPATVKRRGKADDLSRLKKIARAMLKQLETRVEEAANPTKTVENAPQIEAKTKKKKSDSAPVGRDSPLSTLVTLTELIIKIDQAISKKTSGVSGDYPAYTGEALTDADVALVEAFVERVRNQPV